MAGEPLDPHALALATKVSVSPRGNKVRGTHPPGHLDGDGRRQTWDWREPLGSEANTARVRADLEAAPLRTVLSRVYSGEAHLAGYVLTRDGAVSARLPRLTKDSLPWLRSQGYEVVTTCLLADVDTPATEEGPDHQPWTPALLEAWGATWEAGAASGVLSTCGLYLSPRGLRLVQPLARWVPAEEGEASLHGWLQALVAAGVWESALTVKDWTRLMRTPHHRRNGEVVRAASMDLSRMVPVEPPAPGKIVRASAMRTRRGGAPVELSGWEETCPEVWCETADRVGAALASSVRDGQWRDAYLALSGAALAMGLDPEALPAFVDRAHCVDRSYPEWSAARVDRRAIARTTATGWANGSPIKGLAYLRATYPALADALETAPDEGQTALARRVTARLRTGDVREVQSVEAATAELDKALADAWSVVLLAGPPGLGKTEAAIRYAGGLGEIGERAAPGQRLALAVPTHQLAREVVGRAAEKGVRALRVYGPLSHLTNGQPTCIHHEVAEPLVGGGQSVELLFCEPKGGEPCERARDCAARRGAEGDTKGNLIVGPHSLLKSLAGWAGKVGPVVIDEPPEVTRAGILSVDALDGAIRCLGDFRADYARAIAPALHALLAWARELGPVGERVTLEAAIRGGVSAVPDEVVRAVAGGVPAEGRGDAVVLAAMGAAGDDSRGGAPQLTPAAHAVCRKSRRRAEEVGAASGVMLLVWRGLNLPSDCAPVQVRVDDRAGERELTYVGPNTALIETLRRDAPTVMLDAGARLQAPAVERVIGHAPTLIELAVADGAEVTRTMIATGGATRTRWLPKGVPDFSAGLASAIRAAFAWAAEDTSARSLVVISWGGVETALLAAAGRDDEALAVAKALRLPRRVLEEARQTLGWIVRGWGGELRVAHYGNVRGLDHLRDADALVTLGDPRPNLGLEQDVAAWLGVDPEGRLEDKAAAELDQAHGRLRTIHRTKAARCLHVGSVIPAGWYGREVDVRTLKAGRPRTVAAMSGDELRAAREALGMGVREFARALKVSDGTVRRYESGERAVPADMAAATRSLCGSSQLRPKPLSKDSSLGVSGAPTALRGFRAHHNEDAQGVLGAGHEPEAAE